MPDETASTFDHRNLPLLLLQARESVVAQFRPILNANGVTEQQWRIIRVLVDRGPLEPRHIGELCRISSPSLAGVLARMAALGLVDRERLAKDQRRVMVSLTETSRALAEKMAPQIAATYRAIEARVGLEFTGRFDAMLDELIAALGSAADPAPDDGE
jgi:homoprotocatechuate degradation regulator HpaR